MEQKLVQRCETKVNADACKASYPITSVVINYYIDEVKHSITDFKTFVEYFFLLN